MPRISGKLITVTKTPSTVREIWVRANKPRPGQGGIITSEPVRITPTPDGRIEFDAEPGPATLVLVHQSNRRGFETSHTEAMALSIGDDTSLESALLAGQTVGEVHEAEIYRVSAEIRDMLVESRTLRRETGDDRADAGRSRDAAKASQDAAKQSELAAAESQRAAKASQDAAKSSQDAAAGSQRSAKLSQDAAKQSEDSARASSKSAGESAALAGGHREAARFSEQAAKQSQDAAKKSQDAAASSAAEASRVVVEKLPNAGILLRHLAPEVQAEFARIAKQHMDKIIDGATQNYDTLRELEAHLKSGATEAAALVSQMATKLSKDEASKTYATITQLNGKANTQHTHQLTDVGGLQDALNGKVSTSDARLSDARQPTEHTHVSTDISDAVFNASGLAANANRVLRTDGEGYINVAWPIKPTHATPKHYVDPVLVSYDQNENGLRWARRGQWCSVSTSANTVTVNQIKNTRAPSWAMPLFDVRAACAWSKDKNTTNAWVSLSRNGQMDCWSDWITGNEMTYEFTLTYLAQ